MLAIGAELQHCLVSVMIIAAWRWCGVVTLQRQHVITLVQHGASAALQRHIGAVCFGSHRGISLAQRGSIAWMQCHFDAALEQCRFATASNWSLVPRCNITLLQCRALGHCVNTALKHRVDGSIALMQCSFPRHFGIALVQHFVLAQHWYIVMSACVTLAWRCGVALVQHCGFALAHWLSIVVSRWHIIMMPQHCIMALVQHLMQC